MQKKCIKCKEEFIGYGLVCEKCKKAEQKGQNRSHISTNNEYVCCVEGCQKIGVVTPWVHNPPHNIPELNTKGQAFCSEHFLMFVAGNRNNLTLKPSTQSNFNF